MAVHDTLIIIIWRLLCGRFCGTSYLLLSPVASEFPVWYLLLLIIMITVVLFNSSHRCWRFLSFQYSQVTQHDKICNGLAVGIPLVRVILCTTNKVMKLLCLTCSKHGQRGVLVAWICLIADH